MEWKYNDGGRKSAGYRGRCRDCVVRAVAIAAELPYREVYEALGEMGRKGPLGTGHRHLSSPRQGVYRRTAERFLKPLGWRWELLFGTWDELPKTGRLIVQVAGHHMAAVVDGVLLDSWNCQVKPRGSDRIVGFLRKPEPKSLSPLTSQ